MIWRLPRISSKRAPCRHHRQGNYKLLARRHSLRRDPDNLVALAAIQLGATPPSGKTSMRPSLVIATTRSPSGSCTGSGGSTFAPFGRVNSTLACLVLRLHHLELYTEAVARIRGEQIPLFGITAEHRTEAGPQPAAQGDRSAAHPDSAPTAGYVPAARSCARWSRETPQPGCCAAAPQRDSDHPPW